MKPELLAPAGDWEMLRAAINAGADAVYLGIRGLNMRANSRSFTLEELPQITTLCHDNDLKIYLALNTIIYESELSRIREILAGARSADVDAIICWDSSVISMAREYGLDVHISTQASISNSLSAASYESQGATRCVLAREVTLDELKEIKEKAGIEIEVFAHGAMCLSESGRCFISENLYGRSANRGECLQPCRRSYNIVDPETRKELVIEDNYVLSPKDLCILPFIEKVVPFADSLKIEGRGRSPEYVKIVVEVYREALDSLAEGTLTDKKKKELVERLGQVYNRGFSSGFYMGRPIQELTDSYGSKATRKKRYVGYIKNFFKRPMAAEIVLEAGEMRKGDSILIIGPTTGVHEQEVNSMRIDDSEIDLASKSDNVSIQTEIIVRKNDKVYIWEKN